MKNTKISTCVWLTTFLFYTTALPSCNAKGEKKLDVAKIQQIGDELKSLGGRRSGALGIELKCKSQDSKLYWVLEVRQVVLGYMGIDGYSGDDVGEIARKIVKEFHKEDRSTDSQTSFLLNKFSILFVDNDGFTIAEAKASNISSLNVKGQVVAPLHEGWFYRGEFKLDPKEISKISSFQLRVDFTDSMGKLLQEAEDLVEKKKIEQSKRRSE